MQCAVHPKDDIRAKAIRLVRKITMTCDLCLIEKLKVFFYAFKGKYENGKKLKVVIDLGLNV